MIDLLKALIDKVGVQAPVVVILSALLGWIVVGALNENTRTLGEIRGMQRWANQVLMRVDPNGCCKSP